MKMTYSVVIVAIGVMSGLMDECKTDAEKRGTQMSSSEWARQLDEDSKRYNYNTGESSPTRETKTSATYLASDFDLEHRGEVVNFRPQDSYIHNLPDNEKYTIDIYIHIKGDDDIVRIEKTDYKTWVNLDVGDILQ